MSCTKKKDWSFFYMVQDTSTLHTFEIMAFSMHGNHRHDISRSYISESRIGMESIMKF